MSSCDEPAITDLEFGEKPKDVKNRLKEARYRINMKICVHEHVPIEIRGIQGKSGRNIIGIKIAHSKQDANLYHIQGYNLIKQLLLYKCYSSIWILKSKLIGDVNDDDHDLYPLGAIEIMQWTDERLIRCVKIYNLKEFEIFEIKKVFDKMLLLQRRGKRVTADEKHFSVRVEIIFDYLVFIYLFIYLSFYTFFYTFCDFCFRFLCRTIYP